MMFLLSLKLLVSSMAPQVREWVDSIVRDWDFTSIIPCHFTGPVKSSPAEFKRAFSFVYEEADVAASSASGGGFLSSLFGRRPEKVRPHKIALLLIYMNT